jgi:hypothetical protein
MFSKDKADNNSLKIWLLRGLGWAIFMYLFNAGLMPIAMGDQLESWRLLLGIPVWLIGGFLFAILTRYFTIRSERKKGN